MEFDLDLKLVSNTPVVDFELVPEAKIKRIGKDLPDNYSFEFKWYRSKKRVAYCSTHASKFGVLQCLVCLTSGVHAAKSFHCSTECFQSCWGTHRARHIAVLPAGQNVDNIYPFPAFDSSYQSGSESSDISIEGVESWSEIGSSETYRLTLDDFGHRLKLQSRAVDCEGLPLTQTGVIVTDHINIAPDPCPRQMISVGSLGCFTNSSLETQACHDGTLSILTYNVLVDYGNLLNRHPYCLTWARTWEFRRQNLLREIIQYDADILCLQEVQNDHFENFFKPELLKLGYSVFYKEKTNMIFTGKYSTDGCATFFRGNRFTHIETLEIEFREKANSAYANLSQQQKNSTNSYSLAKDNIALIVKLKDIKNGTVFCVANTHIYANPKATDIKVWQVATLINELEEICKSNIPVLVCADLNSLPGSAPHNLVVRGSVDRNHGDLKNTSFAMFEHLKLSHRMRLVSAYSSMLNNDTNEILISQHQRDKMNPKTKEPFFTNFTDSFNGAIDYIFYSGEAFTVKSLLELVDPESLKEYIALPSPHWSSDHIALMAEFYIKLPNKRSFNVRK